MRALAWGLLATLTIAMPATQDPQTRPAPRPVFRGDTAATGVHVAVRRGNRPVAGLTAEDFILTDNFVRQTITAVEVGTLPFDLTIVLDTSGSVTGAALDQLRQDVADLTQQLRPEDRVRFLAFATSVQEIFPMVPIAQAPARPAVTPAGATAFFNALTAALVRPAEAGRPHLVIALTDGGDNVSLIDDRDVRDVARRSDAVLHVVIRGRSYAGGSGWLPFGGADALNELRDAAEITGGRFDRQPAGQSASALFASAVAEFKSGYILWFTPTNVPAAGWHELSVRTRAGGHTVAHRRGYFAGGGR